MWKQFKGILFHLFPHHFVSRFTFWLTRLETPLKNPAIRFFIRIFKVDMNEAEFKNEKDYASFNEFFIRKLLSNSRPIAEENNAIACPADGRISQIGSYTEQLAIQAKGKYFSVAKLLGTEEIYGSLQYAGKFATIYLSPRNYHRVHMPMDGELVEMIYIPGRLFSVAPYAAEVIQGLYSRNERVVSIFKTQIGYMAVVMVGAVNVSAISMAWEGLVTPPRSKSMTAKTYNNITLQKGDELGIFNLGSTAIMLFENDNVDWDSDLILQQEVQMGQKLGKTHQCT